MTDDTYQSALSSLADPAWGEITPPDMHAAMTEANHEERMNFALSTFSVDYPGDHHPCYECGEAPLVQEAYTYICVQCLRPLCRACFHLHSVAGNEARWCHATERET